MNNQNDETFQPKKNEEGQEQKAKEQTSPATIQDLCKTLLTPEMVSRTQEWKNEREILKGILEETIKEEMKEAMVWWTSHSIEEKQTILVMAMDAVAEDENVITLINNIFTEINTLLDNTEDVMGFIGKVSKDSLYCYKNVFDSSQIQDEIGKNLSEMETLECLDAMLSARSCIALKLSINVLMITNQIDN
ncbi:hypothetical protein EIN_461610 [Entamoeba invadens IP1]|uniref:Uncharacterized protein n=1 Tax=Entamoeba invadens IP1 TaxID=370355 RepID=A0A0A1U6E3_ENTIV|nr:hypothetical protein EIN_461610 [Entamoeba invadens IP1]ELP89865.1 hypothetical protein EIN_461610 [Entamoeba invadens IP1]|eukprot:XP_004256636.1 hypothetical protein EIN_461610 [Entamoeba invadens IP1]